MKVMECQVSKKDNEVHASSRWRNSEEWKKRTARRRVKEIDEIKELAIMHYVLSKENVRSAIVSKNKYIIVQQRKESLTLCDIMESFVTLRNKAWY
jgi:hypothetical protein